MRFSILALSAALVAPLVSAYPISGDSVNCRSGPATSYKVIKTYKKGHDVKITCQTVGETIKGGNLWDKTSDGCYVSDYYVKTGTTGRVVKKDCKPGGGTGNSPVNGKITRKEIIARARYWTDRHIPYSMTGYYPDPKGTKYRTDCSGFVAMALHATAPGYSTVDLGRLGKQIAWKDLKPGDFVGTLGPGTGGASGHVTLFLSWTDKTKKAYNTLECRGSGGCEPYKRKVGWTNKGFKSKAYRYKNVV